MMSVTELLSRAKQAIESGETSLRAAADDIAAAEEQGATQRQIAEAVGKSAAWVNRLLKWRESGYQDDTAFGPQAKASRQRARRVQSPERKNQKPASTSEQARVAERRRQIEDHRMALQNTCRQLERAAEEREQRYVALCLSVGRKPEPFSPPLSPENEPPLSVAEDLEQALRVLLRARGFDPAALKKEIADFVETVMAQGQ
jgi:transposase